MAGGDRVHVAVWDVADGRLLHRWDWPKGRDPHSEVESLAFTADRSRLAAADFRQSSAYLWDLTTGRQDPKGDPGRFAPAAPAHPGRAAKP